MSKLSSNLNSQMLSSKLSSSTNNLSNISQYYSEISYFSFIIEEIIEENSRLHKNKVLPNSPFDVLNGKISISIEVYLERITRLLKFNSSELIYTLILLDRFISTSNIVITRNNIYKLILITSYLSNKILKDYVMRDSYYSSVFGVTVKELAILEYNYTNILDFKLFVTEETFNEYKDFYQQSLILHNHNNNKSISNYSSFRCVNKIE